MGTLKEATTRFAALKQLETLPYASKLVFEYAEPINQTLKVVSQARLREIGQDAMKRFKKAFDTGTYEQNQALLKQFVIPK